MVDNPQILVSTVQDILFNTVRTNEMSRIFASFARPNAASDVADMIISCSVSKD